jgi:hypothetical protein
MFQRILALVFLFTQITAYPAAVVFSGSDVKALKANLNLNDSVKILSGSVDPTSSATSAPIGSVYLNNSNGKLYRKLDAGATTNWVVMSSGGDAGVNYVTNSDAEANTTGWTTYADAAAATPVDCTGGAPTATWTRSTSSPLRGTANFLFTKDAANRQGEGVSTPLAIDRADQAKVLGIEFMYEVGSGTWVAGSDAIDSDLEVYVYDVTNATLIQPAGYKLSGGSTGQFKYTGIFQTASNSQSYRLCLHQAKNGTSAYTLKVDSAKVGPLQVAFGSAITDWVSYTPTFGAGFGTVVSPSFKSRRVGSQLEVVGQFTTGTLAASATTITLGYGGTNSNVNIDTASVPTSNLVGHGTTNSTASTTNFGYVSVIAGASNTVSLGLQTSTLTALTTSNGNVMFTTGSIVHVEFKVPILGWGSTVTMSNDQDTRVVAARYSSTAGASIPAGATIIDYATKDYDTHGAVTTGASWKFTCPLPGFYRVSTYNESNSFTTAAASAVVVDLFKNGSFNQRIGQFIGQAAAANTVFGIGNSVTVQCVAGDTLDLRSARDAGHTPAWGTTAGRQHIEVERLTGPATIAATETVAARYTNTAGTTLTKSAANTIPFATKDYDTHGAFVTDTFTAPINGKYSVKANVNIATGATWASGDFIYMEILKNGATHTGGNNVLFFGTYVGAIGAQVSGDVNLLAGDTIKISVNPTKAAAANVTLNTTAGYNTLAIAKIGNYGN